MRPPGAVATVAERMSKFDGTWFLAGDYAVDAWLDRDGDHFGVAIGVFEGQEPQLLRAFAGWRLAASDVREPLADRRWTGRHLQVGDLSTTRPKIYGTSPEGVEVEIAVHRRSGGDWVLHAGTTPIAAAGGARTPVTVPIGDAIGLPGWGTPTVVPEVAMFLEAFGPRARDMTRLRSLLPTFSAAQRRWLHDMIERVEPGYPWSQLIAAVDEPGRRVNLTGELDIDAATVRGLLASQFPQWAGMPLRPVASVGTVNTIFRLGDDMAVRLPRRPRFHDDADIGTALAALAPRLPLAVPEVIAVGEADDTYPWRWSVVRWLEGEPFQLDRVDDLSAAADELAEFIHELRRVDHTGLGLPSPPLVAPSKARIFRRYDTRRACAAAADWLDTRAFLRAWVGTANAARWHGEPVVVHGDLSADNLLVRNGSLHAVIDWGGLQVGDPAADAVAAWRVFAGESRKVFRRAIDVDDDSWERARAISLSSVFTYHYYAHTYPAIAAAAKLSVLEALSDAAR